MTGHRQLGEDFSRKELSKRITELVERGVLTFYCGMAMGFDLTAAKLLLAVKKKNPDVKLIACIPCAEQDKYYSKADKKTYARVLEKVDERVTVNTTYFRGCMHARDRYMAEKADCLLGYCTKKTGGTAYTVGYFQKTHPDGEVILIGKKEGLPLPTDR